MRFKVYIASTSTPSKAEPAHIVKPIPTPIKNPPKMGFNFEAFTYGKVAGYNESEVSNNYNKSKVPVIELVKKKRNTCNSAIKKFIGNKKAF